eukprot:11940647-Heterocapsa_arctica.AAC.1
MVATTEELFVEKIVDPYIGGFIGNHGALRQHIGDSALIRAQMVCVWSDAREAVRSERRRLRSRSRDRHKRICAGPAP